MTKNYSLYSCSDSARDADLEPYGDVAGLGVIASFLGTGWLAVVLDILHYLVVFDPNENPFQIPEQPQRPWTPNPIDVKSVRAIRKIVGWFSFLERLWLIRWLKERPPAVWQSVIEKSILNMCDLQILTGLGILTSGFVDLPFGISAYHFLIITHVAWFSNLTHLAGLTVLRRYLHQRPVEKWIRLFCMGVLSIMLLIAMIPTHFFNWAVEDAEGSASLAGSKAVCFYNISQGVRWHNQSNGPSLRESSAFQSAIISVVLLVLLTTIRILKFQGGVSDAMRIFRRSCSRKVRRFIGRLYENSEKTTGIWCIGMRKVILYTQVTNMLVVRLYLDLLSSTLSDVYWLLVSASWGTFKLFRARSTSPVDDGSVWTFGQSLAVFVLLGPLVTLFQILLGPETAVSTTPTSFRDEADESGRQDEDGTPREAPESVAVAKELGIRRFQQLVTDSLDRNYYALATCPWMMPAIFLTCIQIVGFTIIVFLHITFGSLNWIATVTIGALEVSSAIPAASFLFILASMIYEQHASGRGGYWVYWVATTPPIVLSAFHFQGFLEVALTSRACVGTIFLAVISGAAILGVFFKAESS